MIYIYIKYRRSPEPLQGSTSRPGSQKNRSSPALALRLSGNQGELLVSHTKSDSKDDEVPDFKRIHTKYTEYSE